MAHHEYESEPEIDSIDVKHPHGTLSYTRWRGLQFKGASYERNVADYLPLLEPLKTKSGSIAKRQPQQPRAQPAAWWKAQCIFRGLPPKGTIADLQKLLRGHENDPVPNEIIQLEKTAKKDFAIENRKKKDDNWIHKWSDKEKMLKDPERYLKEKFKEGEMSKEIVQFQSNGTVWVHDIAKKLGLECLTTMGPRDRSKMGLTEHIAVVGQDKAVIQEKIQSIKKVAERVDREIKEEWARKAEAVEAAKRHREKAREASLEKCKDWDVTGTWKIHCPEIMEGYGGGEDEEYTMEIFIQKTKKGPQMFAKFNFYIIEGFMRFERQANEQPKSVKTAVKRAPKAGQKRRRQNDSDDERYSDDERDDDDDDDDEDDNEEDEDRRSPTPEAFYLGPTSQPSAKHPTWNYRYRARETGENEIQQDEDENLYQITFQGPKGRTLKGNIGASLFKKCTFTGVKMEPGGEADIDIGDEWAEHNESSYERARVGRWR